MHANTFLRIVQEEADLRNLDEAKQATQIVFQVLHHRITPDEAEDVRAQLPRELANLWEGGDTWFRQIFSRLQPQNTFNREEFIHAVNEQKGDLPVSGGRLVHAVFYALQHQISPGEAEDVAAQLPRDLCELWESARPLARTRGGGGEAELPPSNWEI